MNAVNRVLAIILLVLFALGLLFFYLRLNFVYIFVEAPLPPEDMPRTQVKMLPAIGEDPALTVWVTEPEEGFPVLLYFMGDSGALGVHEPQLREFAAEGFGIAAMAYRGGAGQPGRPSEEALYTDALRVYAGLDTLFGRHITENNRVIYGYSLGSGLAVRLAAEQAELAVILEAPYTNLCATNIGLGSVIPGCLLLRGQEFDTLSRIDRIEAPLLVMHGTNDSRVPIALGRAVFEAAETPKFMEEYPGGTHEDLSRYGSVQDAISFIQVLRGAR